MAPEHEPGDEELEWLFAELAEEVHLESAFVAAQQRVTQIVLADAEDAAIAGTPVVPSFEDAAMLDLLLDLDPSLADRLDPPAS